MGLSYSPDSWLLASARSDRLQVWDVSNPATPTLVAEPQVGAAARARGWPCARACLQGEGPHEHLVWAWGNTLLVARGSQRVV